MGLKIGIGRHTPGCVVNTGGDNATINYNFLSGSLPSGLTFSRADTGTNYNSSGLVTTAAINEPRFDYNPVTLAAMGILLEPPSTNLVLNSNGDYWNVNGGTKTINAAVSPDGTSNATQVVTTSTNQGLFISGIATTAAQSYTLSLYMKNLSSTNIQVAIEGRAATTVNLTAGTTSFGAITAINNGWYRISFPFTASGSSHTLICYNQVTAAQSWLLWGGQVENLTFATSLIPTTSSAVPRGADVLINTDMPWFNPIEGTFIVEYTRYATSPNTAYLAEFSDNTLNNKITSLMAANASNTNAIITVGGSSAGSGGALTAPAIGAVRKTGLVYKNGANIFASGGVLDGAGTFGASAIPTINRLILGNASGIDRQLIGHLRAFTYYNTAKTSTQLQALTT